MIFFYWKIHHFYHWIQNVSTYVYLYVFEIEREKKIFNKIFFKQKREKREREKKQEKIIWVERKEKDPFFLYFQQKIGFHFYEMKIERDILFSRNNNKKENSKLEGEIFSSVVFYLFFSHLVAWFFSLSFFHFISYLIYI